MLKFPKRWLGASVCALFVAVILSGMVAGAGDPITGRDYTGACGSCHGSKGISTNPMIPSLAGQDRSYLVGQKQFIFKKREEGERFYKACKGCHGDRAEGREGIPRLAGQQAVYLERTLLSYQSGERSAPGMNEAVIPLTSEQVKALSRFLLSLR